MEIFHQSVRGNLISTISFLSVIRNKIKLTTIIVSED